MSQEDKRSIYNVIMNNLTNFLGEMITVIYWENGKLHGLRGILNNIIPYDYVDIEGERINFVGSNMAIQAIASSQDKMLYYNASTENYQGFSFRDIIGLIVAQEELLGFSVKRGEIENKDTPSSGRK